MMNRAIKSISGHYIETGLWGAYETTDIINEGDVSLFEDTELKEQGDALQLDRNMIVSGKRFAIHSVFGKEAHGNPTDKLLTLIDKAG